MSHSVLEMQVALHYWSCCEPYPKPSPAVESALLGLCQDEILVKTETKRGGYDATEKGRAWLTMVCATPYPINDWRDPRNVVK